MPVGGLRPNYFCPSAMGDLFHVDRKEASSSPPGHQHPLVNPDEISEYLAGRSDSYEEVEDEVTA